MHSNKKNREKTSSHSSNINSPNIKKSNQNLKSFFILLIFKVKKNPPLLIENAVHDTHDPTASAYVKCVQGEKKRKNLNEYRERLIHLLNKTTKSIKIEEFKANFPDFFRYLSLPHNEEILKVFDAIEAKC